MGNTAWHVTNNLKNALNTSNLTPLKLAVFAAHDTTIMPFLASILGDRWNGNWAGYASLITIELYARSSQYAATSKNASDLFRIVYNSEVLLVPGCDDTLCDIEVLLAALSFGQEAMPCSVPVDTSNVVGNDDNAGDEDGCGAQNAGTLSVEAWTLVVIFTSLAAAGVGAGAMAWYSGGRFKAAASSEMNRESIMPNGSLPLTNIVAADRQLQPKRSIDTIVNPVNQA
jgi:hypothetical protein